MCSKEVDVVEANELSENEGAQIDGFLKSSSYGNIFQTVGWGKALHEALGLIPRMNVIRNKTKVYGTLLFFEDPRTRHFLAEDAPVLIRDDYGLFELIYQKYVKFCRTNNARRIELHMLPDYSYSRIFRSYSYRAVKEIERPIEALWASLDRKSIRYSVKRAIKKRVRIVEAKSAEDNRHHVRLARCSKIHGKYPTRLNPLVTNDYKILKAILRQCPNNCKVFLAKIGQEPIASVVWLYFQERAYYYDVGLDYSYKEYSGPDYLMWHSIEFFKQLGISRLDLMGVGSSSTSGFKQKWSDRLLRNRYLIETRPDFYLAQLLAYPHFVLNAGHTVKSILSHFTFRHL